MYATNMDDFWFDFQLMIVPTIEIFSALFLMAIVAITTIYYLNKRYSKKMTFYKITVLVIFAIFLCTYIQGNWLVNDLPPLDGTIINWMEYGKGENKIYIAMLIAIGGGGYLLCVKYKLDRTMKIAAWTSIAIFVMLFTALICTMISNKAWRNKDLIGFTTDNFNNVSSDRNFIIFLVDAVDSGEFKNILIDNPEYMETFYDFTYYTDAASVFAFTRDSVPNILSGSIDKNEKEYFEYCDEAYNNSMLFSMLDEQQYDVNIYDDELSWGDNIKWKVNNGKPSGVRFRAYFEQETKYILFKYLPYGLKKFSGIQSWGFYRCRDNTDLDCSNKSIYENIIFTSELNRQSKPQFQFIHIEGGHTPFNYDKDLNYIENGTYSQKIEASINVLNAYLERLKKNDAYDNSVIIIMADHGNAMYNSDIDILKRFNPILLIKGFGERHEMIESDKPVSYLDLDGAYRDLLNGAKSTELFDNIEYGRMRTFIWYSYTKEDRMIEYETNGTMKEINKFKKTGNYFNLHETRAS